MQFGFNLPLSGPSASPAMLARLAAEGEAIGYDYAAISDHIVEPIDIHARYPYSEGGEFPASSRGERHEQLTAIAYLAAKTSRLKFLTSVMVVPHRPAVLTAKILATIDVMSGGRLIVGVGAGWLEEEFVAIGAPPFAERGTATDEYLMAFRELWTKDKPFCSPPSRCRSRARRCGSAAKAGRQCAAPQESATVGIRSAPILSIGSTPWRATGRRLSACASWPPTSAAIRQASRSPFGSIATEPRRPQRLTMASGSFSGSNAEIIDDLRAMRELGVKAIDF